VFASENQRLTNPNTTPMKLKLSIENGDSLRFDQPLPPEILRNQVFHTVAAATGKWGEVIFQGMPGKDVSVWHSNYRFKVPVTLNIEAETEFILLHICYKNNNHSTAEGIGEMKLNKHQFNFFYVPYVKQRCFYNAAEYSMLDIRFSRTYLQHFVTHLPRLKYFLENVDDKIACCLSLEHANATAEMITVITSMLQHQYNNGLSQMYIESKALELLILAINKLSKIVVNEISLTKADIKTFSECKEWLETNSADPGSFKKLARRFNMNEYKLKKGFKQLFDIPAWDYVLKIRMEKAKFLLEETNLQITEIAYKVGYSKPSHFSTAFRKYYNFPPKHLRKR